MPDEIVRRPDPDPTVLTTQQLMRVTDSLREVMEGRFEVIIARLDAMDKAVTLLQTYPTEVDRRVAELRSLHEEKFQSVAKEFAGAQIAVQAALKAREEAVAKTEINTTKQLDSLLTLVNTKNEALGREMVGIANRLTIVESVKKGAVESFGAVFGIIGALAGLGSIVGLILVMATKT